ncbi:MAG: 2TM domain-containing protein [Flavobacteriaceae bacterium]|nr:2TM domain-containing protein [Flavobacteriaceae bacterium]
MDSEERKRSDNYLKAKKRVEDIKGFYIHLVVYVLVNLFISITIIVGNLNSGESLSKIFSSFGVYSVWIFWGIGIFFHAIGVLNTNPLLGKKWEEKKLKEFIEEDKEQSKRLLK